MIKPIQYPEAVVCVDGLGINGLGIVRSLGRIGIRVSVIGVKGDLNLAATSRYCNRRMDMESFDGALLYRKLMEAAVFEKSKPVLFFDNDKMMNLLFGCEAEIRKRFHLTSPLMNMEHLNSKKFQMQLAEKAGIRVPKTWYPNRWEELSDMESATCDRLIAKPCQSVYPYKKPFKAIIGHNIRDLKKRLQPVVSSPKGIMIQEFIDGPDSDIHIALGYNSARKDFRMIFTGSKIIQTTPGAGVMAVGRAMDLPQVRHMTEKLIAVLNYQGIIGVEYKFSGTRNSYYFIEISPRTALYNTLSIGAGLNLPVVAYLDHVDPDRLGNVRVKTDSNHYWINFASDFNSILFFRGFDNFRQLLRPYVGRKQWSVFATDDMKPWLIAVKQFVSTYAEALSARGQRAK